MKATYIFSLVIFYSLTSHADYFSCKFIKRDEGRLQSYFQCGTDKRESCIEKNYFPESAIVSVVTDSGKREEVIIRNPTTTVDEYTKVNSPNALASIRGFMTSKEKISSYKLKSANVKSLSIFPGCDLEKRGMQANYKNCSYDSVTRKVKSLSGENKYYCAAVITCDGTTGNIMCDLTPAGTCPEARTCANSDIVTPSEATMQKVLCWEIVPKTASGKNIAKISGCSPQGSVVAVEQTASGSSSGTSRAAK